MALHEIDPRVFRGPLTWLVMMRQAPVYVRESPRERVWLEPRPIAKPAPEKVGGRS